MTGSVKQIAWAQDILDTYFKAMQDLPELFISSYERRVNRELPAADKNELRRAAKEQEAEERQCLDNMAKKQDIAASQIIGARGNFAPDKAISRVLNRANLDGETIRLAVGTAYGLFGSKVKKEQVK